jgi:thaumarchaeosortase
MRLSWDLKKSWLNISLIACFAMAILLLMFLDYFNLEKIAFFNNIGFLFEYTWKGRLLLFFFFWLFVLISFSESKSLKENTAIKRISRFKLLLIFLVALIPLFYIIGVNFLGLDQAIISIGELLRGEYWRANTTHYENFLTGDWPMSLEYLVFAFAFVATILLTYGKRGLKIFSLPTAVVAGIGIIYMIDTMYPTGAFKPLQALALPTAACAAVLLEALGIRFNLLFSPGLGSMPVIVVNAQGTSVPTYIAWPCAGVHSLFLYTVLILLLFGNSNISRFRKAIYFIVGLVGTYFVNVLRIVTYFVLLVDQGKEVALVFHNVYGELYFFAWMLLYILLIVSIQRYKLFERLKEIIPKNKKATDSQSLNRFSDAAYPN